MGQTHFQIFKKRIRYSTEFGGESMGKKEKDKSKKYQEYRAIVREELENALRNLSINVQFDFVTQAELEAKAKAEADAVEAVQTTEANQPVEEATATATASETTQENKAENTPEKKQ